MPSTPGKVHLQELARGWEKGLALDLVLVLLGSEQEVDLVGVEKILQHLSMK
jgi:hypothetical protein